MTQAIDITTNEDIDRALENAALYPDQPSALAAEYIRSWDLVCIQVNDGRRLFIPRQELQGLENATPDQLANIQIFGFTNIAWPDIDVNHYLPYLLEGRYATERWKASRPPRTIAA